MYIQLPPVQDLLGYVAGIVTIILLAAKKFKDFTGAFSGKNKSEISESKEAALLEFTIKEKDSAIDQRNDALAVAEQLKRTNNQLEADINKLQTELQLMKNRLVILTELNNRLAQNLDEAQKRLFQHMAGIEPMVPQTPLEEAQAVILQGEIDNQDAALTIPMLLPQNDTQIPSEPLHHSTKGKILDFQQQIRVAK